MGQAIIARALGVSCFVPDREQYLLCRTDMDDTLCTTQQFPGYFYGRPKRTTDCRTVHFLNRIKTSENKHVFTKLV